VNESFENALRGSLFRMLATGAESVPVTRRPAMKFLSIFATFLFAAASLSAHAADTVTDPNKPRALPDSGPVAVSWSDPAQFSDLRFSRNRWEANRGDWVRQLAEHFRSSATRQLQPGEKLQVNITDIMRAGSYEPWRGPNMDHVRFIRDRYPPSMAFSYTLTGADGQVLAQSDIKLRDLGFMMSASPTDTDPLRFEKRMIDNWLRRNMRTPSTATASR
jgi:hypothetical protein